jgi:nitrogen regulatory protein PII
MNSVFSRNSNSGFGNSLGNSLKNAAGIETEPKHDWVKIALIVGVLALLGLNIFTYLSQITEWFSRTFGSFFRGTVGSAVDVVGDTATQTIQTAAEGTEAVVKGAAKGATAGIGELQSAISGQMMKNNIDNRNINMELSQADPQFVMEQDDDDVDETIINKKTKGRSGDGFCYIGEDNGVRSCLKVGRGERCMSGQIFPTMDVCVNPNLRA